ncbi:MAG: porin, partial [Vicinamibacterales bacterium]
MRTAITALLCALAATSAAAQQPTADDEKFRIAPTGYVQFDFRAFPDWNVVPGTGRLNRATAEVRRVRAGVDGRWRRLTFELSVDPQDDDGVFVKDAYAQVQFSRAFRIRAGQFKVPGTRDYDVSARRIDFLERTPLASSLGVGRDVGARLDGRRGPMRYDVGLFAGDGVGRDDRAGVTAAARVSV